MASRQNFTEAQRQSTFQCNGLWLRDHRVDGVEIALPFEGLRRAGRIYYCENCLFCHTEQAYFDVDHLVPDAQFRRWGRHPEARLAVNMAVLCKSVRRADLGCNQSKGAAAWVPRGRGLAFTRREIDMNWVPLDQRPFDWTRS